MHLLLWMIILHHDLAYLLLWTENLSYNWTFQQLLNCILMLIDRTLKVILIVPFLILNWTFNVFVDSLLVGCRWRSTRLPALATTLVNGLVLLQWKLFMFVLEQSVLFDGTIERVLVHWITLWNLFDSVIQLCFSSQITIYILGKHAWVHWLLTSKVDGDLACMMILWIHVHEIGLLLRVLEDTCGSKCGVDRNSRWTSCHQPIRQRHEWVWN